MAPINVSFDGNSVPKLQNQTKQFVEEKQQRVVAKNLSIERISEEEQENNPNTSRGSLQYVLVDDGQTILPSRRKLKLNEINKAGVPVYQLDKNKSKKQKNGDTFVQV